MTRHTYDTLEGCPACGEWKMSERVSYRKGADGGSGSSRMFNVVTKTWNPVTGCLHGCAYCWGRKLAETKLKFSKRYRYGFTPSLNIKEFSVRFNNPGFACVFVSDMGDLFGSFIPDEWVEKVLKYISKFPRTQFLFLTKNPMRYHQFLEQFSKNAILGATIETDYRYFYRDISKAPFPDQRIKAMAELDWDSKFISIEPILKFSKTFHREIASIEPFKVYVGYDNYHHKLPEPRLRDTLSLIEELESCGFPVFKKSISRFK